MPHLCFYKPKILRNHATTGLSNFGKAGVLISPICLSSIFISPFGYPLLIYEKIFLSHLTSGVSRSNFLVLIVFPGTNIFIPPFFLVCLILAFYKPKILRNHATTGFSNFGKAGVLISPICLSFIFISPFGYPLLIYEKIFLSHLTSGVSRSNFLVLIVFPGTNIFVSPFFLESE